MFQIITLIIMFITCVLGIWFPWIAWIIMLSFNGLLFLHFYFLRKNYNPNNIQEISPAANKFFTKYCHYYHMPFACRDFSACATTLKYGSLMLAIICFYFSDFNLGIVFFMIIWVMMGYVANCFTPGHILQHNDEANKAHDEILNYLKFRQKTVNEAES